MNINNKYRYYQFLVILCTSLIFYLVGLYIITMVMFLLNNNDLLLVYIITILISIFSIIYISIYKYHFSFKLIIINIILFGILLYCSQIFSKETFDFSWDGRSYHFFAQYHIYHGWNPIYYPLKYIENITVTTYSKAPWYSGAVIFTVFNSYEASKSINFILVITSFLSSLILLIKINKYQNIFSFLVSIVIALNPVCLYQLSTHYVDGQLGSCITILIASLILDIINKDKIFALWILLISIYCLNIKTTGLLYVIIILFSGIVSKIILNKNLLKGKKINILKHILCIPILTLLISLAIAINPYIYNIIYFGNPIYPFGNNLIGNYAIFSNKISNNNSLLLNGWEFSTPKNLINQNRIIKFIISNFSISSISTDTTKLKIPFTIIKNEFINTYEYPDIRSGGFGPLYSGLIILMILEFYILYISNKKAFITCLLINILIMISILLISDCWWARYVPQAWLLPIIPLVGIIISCEKKNIITIFISCVLICMLINIYIVGIISISKNMKYTNELYTNINNIKQQKNNIVISKYSGNINNDYYFGLNFEYFLKENGIKYYYVNNISELPCSPNQLLLPQTIYSLQKCN